MHIEVEVVLASKDEQVIHRMRLPPGSTVLDAISAAGLVAELRAEGRAPLHLACYGRLITPQCTLNVGDRIELLRPLLADPKERRRVKARAAAKSARKAASNKSRRV